MVDAKTADKISYWQTMHREAGVMLSHMSSPDMLSYYRVDDHAYVKAWMERQAFCFRQIVRHRGF